ncbi:hypothetical protein Y1Q_0002046 [Alligator mississippiensis]|uniref:Uncharacterized protein n=1 Tax=Alligator mississippiensis TaxID=8496 RepID=A0A151MIX0_ALLMI|nr:hypothetical protein Y1Q_0002046 [Alligator mississippiensis]
MCLALPTDTWLALTLLKLTTPTSLWYISQLLSVGKAVTGEAILEVCEVVAGAKLKNTCLDVGKLGDLESLGVSVPNERVKILGMEFDHELSRRKTWEKTQTKDTL